MSPKICTLGATKGLNRTNANKFLIDLFAKQKARKRSVYGPFGPGGDGGIRTHVGLHPNGFQAIFSSVGSPNLLRFQAFYVSPKPVITGFLVASVSFSQSCMPNLGVQE